MKFCLNDKCIKMENAKDETKLNNAEDSAVNSLEESSVTMLDVWEQEKEMEETCAAVLGGSDEKICTYIQGAVKRQALYSCLTCCPEGRDDFEKCAGICLACSYQCHENHELVELYTKRNFRCDCPTERTGANRCCLNENLKQPAKINSDNLYNQNFQGLYCTCNRPYPDPELTTEQEMFQCEICEDWFHLQHINSPPDAAKLMDACSEIICDSCMNQHQFLHSYTGLALKTAVSQNDATEDNPNVAGNGDVPSCEDNDDNKLKSDLDKSISEIMNMSETGGSSEVGEEPCAKRQKLLDVPEIKDGKKCRRPTLKSVNEKGPTFWAQDWRSALCRCPSCMAIYEREKVEYLLDAEDSAKSYEERGLKKHENESTYEQGIRALASIDRVQQINVITEYNRMKDKLKEYLQTFAATNKVVTEEDINRFFSEIRNEDNVDVGLPYMCR